jgi:uncharacterized membrane protein YjgN (DUF898 family)
VTLISGSAGAGHGFPVGPSVRRLYFYGSGPALFGIQIANVLFSLLTLGVFHFWGKARVLRYLLSQTELDGDRFAYHGTGRELLFGFLKALLLFALPVALLNVKMVDPSFGLWIDFTVTGGVSCACGSATRSSC